jgi:hypothetical protein
MTWQRSLFALVVLMWGFIAGVQLRPTQGPIKAHATWAEQFSSSEDLLSAFSASGDPIVDGTVLAVAEGRVVTDEGEDPIQFSDVTFSVQCQSGTLLPGSVTIEVTGDYYSQSGAGDGALMGIPNLRVGANFLLFLRPGPGSAWHIVSNQGGFEVVDGTLQAADPEDSVVPSSRGSIAGACPSPGRRSCCVPSRLRPRSTYWADRAEQ